MVICPLCHKNGDGKRVEMTRTDLPAPNLETRDRYPGQPEVIPAIYFYRVRWTCPDCKYEQSE